eukprot:6491796-Prymnesium_polylepis.1
MAAQASEASKRTGLEIVAEKFLHEVSYNTPLVEVDVGAFEKEIAQMAGVQAIHAFVDIRVEGDGQSQSDTAKPRLASGSGCLGCSKGSSDVADPGPPVELRTRLIKLQTVLFVHGSTPESSKKLLHSLASSDSALIKMSTERKVSYEPVSSAVVAAFQEKRSGYEETRKLYDIEYTQQGQVHDAEAVTAAEEKLMQMASDIRTLLEAAGTEGRNQEEELTSDAEQKRQEASEAKQALTRLGKDSQSAELKLKEEAL